MPFMNNKNSSNPGTPLKQTKKNMATALETIKDPALKKVLTRIMTNLQHSEIHKEAEKFKKEALSKPKKTEQKLLAFLPHQMAKTSIFFPMSDKELKEDRRMITKIEHQTNWGKVAIEGIKLAIFEEDILLVLLFLVKDNILRLKNEFILKTNMKRIINLLYGREGYSKKNEKVVLRTLKHFELVSFDLIVGQWKKKGKERLNIEKIRSIGNIVSGFTYDIATKDIQIYFNPQFFEYFIESMLTNINFSLRRKLRKDGSKALLRFLSTHTNPDRMHMLTVLNAINFNTNQPMFRLRARFKSFIGELKRQGVLGPKTKFKKDDTVFFDILPLKKVLPV